MQESKHSRLPDTPCKRTHDFINNFFSLNRTNHTNNLTNHNSSNSDKSTSDNSDNSANNRTNHTNNFTNNSLNNSIDRDMADHSDNPMNNNPTNNTSTNNTSTNNTSTNNTSTNNTSTNNTSTNNTSTNNTSTNNTSTNNTSTNDNPMNNNPTNNTSTNDTSTNDNPMNNNPTNNTSTNDTSKNSIDKEMTDEASNKSGESQQPQSNDAQFPSKKRESAGGEQGHTVSNDEPPPKRQKLVKLHISEQTLAAIDKGRNAKKKLCENFKCGKQHAGNRPGPNGERLCESCYNRFIQAGKSGEEWREKDSHNMELARRINAGDKNMETCGNFKCGKQHAGNRPGPNGERLCHACYRRYLRAGKVGEEWREPQTAGSVPPQTASSVPPETGSSVPPETASSVPPETASSVLPKTKSPVPPETGSSVPPETASSEPRRDDCENCGKQHARIRSGPDGERLCNACYKRYLKAGKRGEEWREPAKMGRPMGNSGRRRDEPATCKDCGTHEVEAVDLDDGLCEFCATRRDAYHGMEDSRPLRRPNSEIPGMSFLTHAAIRDLAVQTFRELHPSHDAFQGDLQPRMTSNNYWKMINTELANLLQLRGVLGFVSGIVVFEDRIRYLQIVDALNGIMPMPTPAGASRYQTMATKDLIPLSDSYGFSRQRPRQRRTRENMIAFMCYVDAGGRDALVKPWEKIPEDEVPNLVQTFLDSLPQNLANSNDNRPLDVAGGITHWSHNRGLIGTAEAHASLTETTMHNLHPGTTSSEGYLCGPRALAESLHAMQRAMRNQDRTREPPSLNATQLMHRLMGLLFTNYVPGEMTTPNQMGQLTPAYEAYIRNNFGGNIGDAAEDSDAVQAFSNIWWQHTRMNNLDLEQLAAMLQLAYEDEDLDDVTEHFGFGVVRGAYTAGPRPDGTRPDVPADARIVRAGAEGVPVVWVHNNVALGYDLNDGTAPRYNHFESFVMDGNPNLTMEWGVRFGDSGIVEAPRFAQTASTTYQTTTGELRNIWLAAGKKYTYRMKQVTRCCIRCQQIDAEDLNCNAEPGKMCDSCKEEGLLPTECVYNGPVKIKTKLFKASEATEEDLRAWDSAMENMEELYELSLDHQPTPDPGVKHFLVIACIRMSSHPGIVIARRHMNDLLISVNTYDNLLNSPFHNNVNEGTRPGGPPPNPNLPMRFYAMAFARHGCREVPTNTGNVQDPFLVGHVNLIDQVTDPNNANPPEEIVYLLMGLPGFSVPFHGWVEFFRELQRRDAQNGTDMARRVFLLPVVDPSIINGLHPSSVDPNRHLGGWLYWQNKAIRKFSLSDLYHRYMLQQAIAHHNLVNPLNHIPVPAGPGTQDLDDMLEGLQQEGFWRSGHLGQNTVPTEHDLAGRNIGRNDAWQ